MSATWLAASQVADHFFSKKLTNTITITRIITITPIYGT